MIGLVRAAVLAGALGVASAASAADPAPVLKLETIRVQLLYTTTGTLSEDIAPPADFSLFNTVIGEGSAAEPANDFLVSVVVSSPEAQANATLPVVITVRGENGKVLGKRTFDSVFVDNHRVVASLLVTDATCAGPVYIEAVMGAQKLRAHLEFSCGE